MKAKIMKTVYGDYYFDLYAETSAEKVLITELRHQAEERGGLSGFGGASGPDEELDMHLDYMCGFKVKSKEVVEENPVRRRLFRKS